MSGFINLITHKPQGIIFITPMLRLYYAFIAPTRIFVFSYKKPNVLVEGAWCRDGPRTIRGTSAGHPRADANERRQFRKGNGCLIFQIPDPICLLRLYYAIITPLLRPRGFLAFCCKKPCWRNMFLEGGVYEVTLCIYIICFNGAEYWWRVHQRLFCDSFLK